MSATTFRQRLIDRNRLLHIKAVWAEMEEHLRKFIDTDAAPAKMGIKSEGEGIVVPQDVVVEVQVIVQGLVQEITNKIDTIDQCKVAEHVKAEPEERKSDEAESSEKRKTPKRTKHHRN